MSYYAPTPSEDYFDEEIDLHGYTTGEAKDLIDELIRDKAGKIRLIVGRGLRSEFVPVLPSFVVNYLSQKGVAFDNSKDGVVDCNF